MLDLLHNNTFTELIARVGAPETNQKGDSSISRMPGCGPNALPKNWI